MGEREYLEFYRIDVSGPMRRVLIPSGLLVTFGASMVCFAAAVHGSHLWKPIVGFLGASGVVTGLLSTIVGMSRMLVGNDSYVAVAADGLVVRSKGADTFFAWAEVTRVVFDSGAVMLELHEKPAVRLEQLLPTAKKMQDLALRLEDWRRKSPYNLAPGATR